MLSRRLIISAVPLFKSTAGFNAPAMTIVSRNIKHLYSPGPYKHPTMDDIPVPCGSWQENHDNYQRKYNIHLLMGVGFLIISFSCLMYSGYFKLYMFYPDKPAPRDS